MVGKHQNVHKQAIELQFHPLFCFSEVICQAILFFNLYKLFLGFDHGGDDQIQIKQDGGKLEILREMELKVC